MTDAAGATAAERRYYPWGTERYVDAAVPTARLYTGQIQDGTGLYYYNARYYDPWLGRFISADTVVPGMANPQAFNRYSYVLNRPLLLIDPTGNYPEGRPDRPVPDVIVETPETDAIRLWKDRHLRPYAVSPVSAKYPVTGPFGAYGNCPDYSPYKDDYGAAYYHPGVDYGVGVGTALYATRGGVVVAAGDFGGGYGSGVVIWHPYDKAYTAYYHMKEDGVTVSRGDIILTGDPIGQSGATGRGTGPHLHFEIIREDAVMLVNYGKRFEYAVEYNPYTPESLLAGRISPSEWFGPQLGSLLEGIGACPTCPIPSQSR